MPAMDPQTGKVFNGDIATQAELCCEAVSACLEAAGSSLEKVLKVTIYAANSAHFKRINEVYGRYFTGAYPARTFVAVGSWPSDFDM